MLNRCLRRALLALLSVATVDVSAASPASPTKKVHVAVGVDATDQEADRYIAANLQLVQKDVPQAVRTCARGAKASLIADFELAVEVGKGGKPGKSVTTPANTFTRCVAGAVGALKFTEPPRAPLGVYFEVSFGK